MIYKFKSRATGDVIMLEANGRRVLQILGKEPTSAGILLVSEIPAALKAIEDAVIAEEKTQKLAIEAARASGLTPPVFEVVSLRQRTTPFAEMLRRSFKDDREIVWGV
jgi:Domain of unknown function (DUF1840)